MRWISPFLVSLTALACSLAGCADSAGRGDGTGSGDGLTSGTSSADTDDDAPDGTDGGGSTGGKDPDTGGSTGDDAPTPKFDVGGDFDPDGTDGAGACEKVDLLFVIDDSGSMGDNQAELVSSFPDFIAGIISELSDTEEYHVGVVTTDGYAHNAPGCTGRGDLVTQTGGEASSNAVCGPYASTFSYMGEQDDLNATFSCAAQVGISGDPGERPIDSIRGALAESNQQAGACNEGFLRDDALLVMVIITDEDDVLTPFDPGSGSLGDPPEWFQEVVDRKGGIETNVVVLTLAGNNDVPNDCVGAQAATASRLIEFTNLFTHGFLGDVCAPSYAPFFAEAVGVIDSACNGFVPPG